MKMAKFFQKIVILGASLLGSACILQTAAPTAQIVVVTATEEGSVPVSPTPTPDAGAAPTAEPTWTLTLLPSHTHTPTIAPVTMTAGQSLSCVKGPDWKLYEWVAGIAEGETVTLIARAVPEIPDYYVVRKSNGTECWAFSGSSAISGSTASLPVRETPPLPTVNFVVRNRIHLALLSLFIRAAGSAEWGANRMAAPIPDMVGETTVSITAGYYDVRVLDVMGHVMYEAYNRAIGADDTYRILEVAPDVNFTIRNDHPFSICWIDIAYSGGSWEKLYATEDGGGSIYTGNTRTFTLRAGAYAARIKRCTSAILPATGFTIYPGMPVIVLS